MNLLWVTSLESNPLMVIALAHVLLHSVPPILPNVLCWRHFLNLSLSHIYLAKKSCKNIFVGQNLFDVIYKYNPSSNGPLKKIHLADR